MRNIFWQTLKKNGLLLVILIAAIIASIAMSVTPPLILQYIVDSLVSGSFSAYPLLTAGILYFALNAGSGLPQGDADHRLRPENHPRPALSHVPAPRRIAGGVLRQP